MRDARAGTPRSAIVLLLAVALVVTACRADVPPPLEPAAEAEPTNGTEEAGVLQTTVGYVSAIDHMGLPAALDIGFFEDHELEVELAQPFPTGVDALNALQSGDVDFVQAGIPAVGAILQGMDLVFLATMTGSASQAVIDDIMAMVAREDSGIDPDDLTTLEGKRVGVSVGSVNHMYLLGLLEEVGLSADDVEIVNTPPPEMPVAIETAGLDAIVVWDPWPLLTIQDVEGAYEVIRGGGHGPNLGYIIALRDFVEANPEIVERLLLARAEGDQWVRTNPAEAADLTVRWLPGTDLPIAREALENARRQLDPRFSACNYLAMHISQELLLETGAIEETFEVGEPFEPRFILDVMDSRPELFDDLEPVPEGAQISADYQFDPQAAEAACT